MVMSPFTAYAHPDDLRTLFSAAMSEMYQKEVPLYSELLRLVRDVNEDTMRKDPALRASLEQRSELERLGLERHGAIRVGKPEELRTLARIFRLFGMEPVGYYDLSTSGLPVHATAFRPTQQESLDRNPFRIFTSLLRPDLISDTSTRELALECLKRRQIFSEEALRMLDKAEADDGRLLAEEAASFVQAVLHTFRWHSRSLLTKDEYDRLSSAHKLAADICGFQSCHINHLTPRTLDIEAVQRGMAERNIPPKAMIEGPPPLACPILLRQTSFLALSESIEFLDQATGGYVRGHHQARFGEIEQRSLALTDKGRNLYTRCLQEAKRTLPVELAGSPAHSKALDLNLQNERHLQHYFATFPDAYEEIRKQELGFFRYKAGSRAAASALAHKGADELTLDELVSSGAVEFEPLLYEDFLPASAAGIFASNLTPAEGSGGPVPPSISCGPDQISFERALGRPIIDEMELYEGSQQESLETALEELGIAVKLVA